MHSEGRRAVMTRVVKKHLNNAFAQFVFLKEASWSARFNNFNVSETVATKALEHLATIKKLCSDEV